MARRYLSALLVFLGLAATAQGTTYVVGPDAELVDEAPLIAVGQILEVTPAAAASSPATDYRFDIQRVLKGTAGLGLATVRVPGGRRPDGSELRVFGMPTFRRGERALLMLAPRPDGAYGVWQLALGAFTEQRSAGRRVAGRDFDGAHVRLPGGGGEAPTPETPRDFAAFTEWVADRAAGWERPADYWRPGLPVPARRLDSVTGTFNLLGHARWFVFDGGGSAAWSFQSTGYDGSGGGAGDFGAAVSAWDGDPGSTIAYTVGGPSSPNSIAFNDPGGDVSGTFNCGGGGVLGIGGYSASGTGQYNGETFDRIVNGFIVINDDNDGNPATSCACFFQNPAAAEEVFAHELGHSLGLDHSTVSGALMRATAYNDGRGAQLGSDDRAGIAFLYGSGSPPPPPTPPAAPSNLEATATSTSQIQILWQDNSNNETSFRIEMRSGGGSFSEIGSTGANTIGATVSGLQSATTYTFRVRARNANGNSGYSNEASATTLNNPPPPPPPPPPGGPAAPSNLQAAAQSTSRIRLTWSDNSGSETAFHVEMSADGFSYNEVGTVAANLTTTDIEGLLPAKPYSFRVRARNANGFSTYSNTASATTQGAPPSPPAAPSGLSASPLPSGQIQLGWQDNSPDETSFHIEARSGGGGFAEVAATGPNAAGSVVGGLTPGTTYTFRVRARNGAGASPYSNEASATTTTPLCSSDPDAICLQGNRFAVSLEWVSPSGQRSKAHPVRLTDDSATFWFLNPANTEVLVKVHNGCAVPGQPAYWVFAAGLTNVNTELRVRDTRATRARFYENDPGLPFQPIQDTDAFETCDVGALTEPAMAPAAPPSPVLWAPADLSAPATTCTTDSTRLCLRGGRFKVETFWRATDGRSGTGTPVALGDQSGYFWFFNPANVEVLAKVHNGCALPQGRYWVFGAGLTNVEVKLRITDLLRNQVREYVNPLGTPFKPVQSTNAFATCP